MDHMRGGYACVDGAYPLFTQWCRTWGVQVKAKTGDLKAAFVEAKMEVTSLRATLAQVRPCVAQRC